MILASASARRAAILASLGIDFHVHAANVHETVQEGESPHACAQRLSVDKARAVAGEYASEWVLAGDTVVTIGGDTLGKPRDELDAIAMLMRLQGRTHHVISGLALIGPAPPFTEAPTFAGTQLTVVTFRSFGADTARAYASTGEPADKAGGYGIQGKGATLVDRIDGDYTCIVGLPVPLLLRLLEQAGRPYRFTLPTEGG